MVLRDWFPGSRSEGLMLHFWPSPHTPYALLLLSHWTLTCSARIWIWAIGETREERLRNKRSQFDLITLFLIYLNPLFTYLVFALGEFITTFTVAEGELLRGRVITSLKPERKQLKEDGEMRCLEQALRAEWIQETGASNCALHVILRMKGEGRRKGYSLLPPSVSKSNDDCFIKTSWTQKVIVKC